MAKGPKRSFLKLSNPSGSSEPSPEQTKINLADGASIKRALDEAAAEALTSLGYRELHYVSNVKIGISSFLCVLAAVAQFWPQKFPDNWLVLVVCVSLYGIGTIGLNLFTSRVEGDAFLFLQSEETAGAPELRVTSKLPRFSYQYELIITSEERGPVSLKQDVQNFFHSDGQLSRKRFKAEVSALLAEYKDASKKLQ